MSTQADECRVRRVSCAFLLLFLVLAVVPNGVVKAFGKPPTRVRESLINKRCWELMEHVGGVLGARKRGEWAVNSQQRLFESRKTSDLISHLMYVESQFNFMHSHTGLVARIKQNEASYLLRIEYEPAKNSVPPATRFGIELKSLFRNYPFVTINYNPLYNHEAGFLARVDPNSYGHDVVLSLGLEDFFSFINPPRFLLHERVHIADHAKSFLPENFSRRLFHTRAARLRGEGWMIMLNEEQAMDLTLRLQRNAAVQNKEFWGASADEQASDYEFLANCVALSRHYQLLIREGLDTIVRELRQGGSGITLDFPPQADLKIMRLMLHYRDSNGDSVQLEMPVNLDFDLLLGAEIAGLRQARVTELSQALRTLLAQELSLRLKINRSAEKRTRLYYELMFDEGELDLTPQRRSDFFIQTEHDALANER